MDRIVEPELMLEETQSLAYFEADFEQPHNYFIELFKQKFGTNINGNVLDLGCGTGDITLRFAKAYPHCYLEGIDGSKTMLFYAQKSLASCEESIKTRVKLTEGILPNISLSLEQYDIIISNSLLHHLHNPLILWQSLKRYSQKDTKIFIMDLLRPQTREEAHQLVKTYVNDEPEILQRDFFNSLLASFTIPEIRQQLDQEKLDYLTVEQISDRHLLIFGEYQNRI
jgi:ubiquinone/menaquinone biosynthesis C-methylase UbiE